jgi:hypothetical protein
MEPASTIVKSLGGPAKVSRLVGVHRVSVSKWMRPKEAGGTGGIIPVVHAPKLLSEARALGVPLSSEDFIPKAGTAP